MTAQTPHLNLLPSSSPACSLWPTEFHNTSQLLLSPHKRTHSNNCMLKVTLRNRNLNIAKLRHKYIHTHVARDNLKHFYLVYFAQDQRSPIHTRHFNSSSWLNGVKGYVCLIGKQRGEKENEIPIKTERWKRKVISSLTHWSVCTAHGLYTHQSYKKTNNNKIKPAHRSTDLL